MTSVGRYLDTILASYMKLKGVVTMQKTITSIVTIGKGPRSMSIRPKK